METYLMSYDDTGNVITYYPKSALSMYSTIPAQVVEITEEQHQLYLTGEYKLNLLTMQPESLPVTPSQPQPPTLEDRLSSVEAAITALMGV